jgi:hypothetical protein
MSRNMTFLKNCGLIMAIENLKEQLIFALSIFNIAFWLNEIRRFS